jgi:uncharacterized glyoxalase superfamily protein PhnB
VELRLGDDFIMPEPREAGGSGAGIPLGSKHQLYVAVEDADAHHDRAKAAGAEIVIALHDTDHGSRDSAATDPEGNTWYIGTYRPRRLKPGEQPAPRPRWPSTEPGAARFRQQADAFP